MMEWCRLWHDLPNDPKWRTVAKISKQPVASVISVYVHLLVQASSNATERGRTQPNAEDLASALDLKTEQVEAILGAMEGRVLDKTRLTGWGKRQPKREDESAERSKTWREMKRLEKLLKETNARERTRTQTTNRRDGDETETRRRRDGDVLVVNDLLPSTETLETNGRNGNGAGIRLTDQRSVRPSSPNSQIEEMRDVLHRYMTEGGRKLKPPDDEITGRCILAIGNHTVVDAAVFLRDRFVNHKQSPRHPSGPKKYPWFITVLSEQFGGPK